MTSQMKIYVLATAFDESILFVTNLVPGDIDSNTWRDHAILSLHSTPVDVSADVSFKL